MVHNSWWIRIRRFSAALDLPGLVLLASGVALLLIPLALSHTTTKSQEQKSHLLLPTVTTELKQRVGLFSLGLLLLVAFLVWDLRHASSPVIARPFIRNKTVLIAAAVGFFDFVSYVNPCAADPLIARS